MIDVDETHAEIEEAFTLGFLAGQAPTPQDAYTWCAVYSDGQTIITEHDVDSFADIHDVDIPSSCVKMLLLLPIAVGDEMHRMDIPSGATPIFFRRRSIEFNLLTGDGNPLPTTHCIGWKRGEEASYLFILPDGSTLLTDDLQAV